MADALFWARVIQTAAKEGEGQTITDEKWLAVWLQQVIDDAKDVEVVGEAGTQACKGCGAKIVFGVTNETPPRNIPLDPRAPIYVLERDVEGGNVPCYLLNVAGRKRVGGAMVSHFCTCVKASDFSRANR